MFKFRVKEQETAEIAASRLSRTLNRLGANTSEQNPGREGTTQDRREKKADAARKRSTKA